mgnify:CR=1 FL=1
MFRLKRLHAAMWGVWAAAGAVWAQETPAA